MTELKEIIEEWATKYKPMLHTPGETGKNKRFFLFDNIVAIPSFMSKLPDVKSPCVGYEFAQDGTIKGGMDKPVHVIYFLVKTGNMNPTDKQQSYEAIQEAKMHMQKFLAWLREQQEKQEAAYAGIHEEIAKIDADKTAWNAEQEQMAEQMQLSVNQENEITEQNKTLAQQVENKNLEIESVSQDLNEILLEIAQKQQQKSFQQQNIQRIAEEIRRLEQEKAQILHDSANSESVIEEREAQIRQLQEQSEETVQQKTELDEKLAAIRGEKETMLAEQKTFFTQREELSQIMSNLDKEMFRLNQQKEKTENAQESLNNYMWEEYEITPNNALQYRKEELTDRKRSMYRI